VSCGLYKSVLRFSGIPTKTERQEPWILRIGHLGLGLNLGLDVVFECLCTVRCSILYQVSNVQYSQFLTAYFRIVYAGYIKISSIQGWVVVIDHRWVVGFGGQGRFCSPPPSTPFFHCSWCSVYDCFIWYLLQTFTWLYSVHLFVMYTQRNWSVISLLA